MDNPGPRSQNPAIKYETTDFSVRGVVIFTIGLFASLAITAILVLFAMRAYSWLHPPGEPISPMADQVQFPPDPRLEVEEGAQLEKLREHEDDILNHYGWVDRNAGVVRIPIDRAMQLIAGRGLPAGAQAAPPEKQKLGEMK